MITSQSSTNTHVAMITRTRVKRHCSATTNPLSNREEDAFKKKGADKQEPITDQHINLWRATSRQPCRAHTHTVSTLCYYICKQPCSFYTYYKYMAGHDHKGHCRRREMYPVKHWSPRARKQQILNGSFQRLLRTQKDCVLTAMYIKTRAHTLSVCRGSRRLCKKEVETKRESKEGHVTPWIKPLSVPMLR